jgi:hypothetical protein
MEHFREEPMEEILFGRDEQIEDQMEQLIYNNARAEGGVNDDDFDQFLNDYEIGMESQDVTATNSGGEV